LPKARQIPLHIRMSLLVEESQSTMKRVEKEPLKRVK
jgi:hypothetical protein